MEDEDGANERHGSNPILSSIILFGNVSPDFPKKPKRHFFQPNGVSHDCKKNVISNLDYQILKKVVHVKTDMVHVY
jgi:hypothetical protein